MASFEDLLSLKKKHVISSLTRIISNIIVVLYFVWKYVTVNYYFTRPV